MFRYSSERWPTQADVQLEQDESRPDHPAEPHILATADPAQPWHMRSLHIPARWLEERSKPLLQPAPMPLDDALRSAFQAVWSACDRGHLPSALAQLAAVLCGRPGLEPIPKMRSDLVRRCLDYLARHVDRPVSCVELARVVRSSPAHLRRAFVAATGLPPHAWHLQRRVAEAKHRLMDGATIVDVALSTGFSDQAHFTRHFSRLVGVSPSRYVAGPVPAF